MTTEAVAAAGIAVTGLAGGRVEAWGGNARIGGDDLYVVEADEYDQAFLTLHPTIAVVNNVEADHLECYGSLDALEGAFVTFAARAERALVGNDSAGADRVAAALRRRRDSGASARCPPISRSTPSKPPPIGHHRDADAARRRRGAASTPGSRTSQSPKRHRRHRCGRGARVETPSPALAGARRVYRRRAAGSTDSANSAAWPSWTTTPTTPPSCGATLAAARQAFPDRRLVALFQPHLFSRTAAAPRSDG